MIKYNIADSMPMISEKEIIEQPSIGRIHVHTDQPNALLITMGPGEDSQSSAICIDRANIDQMIQALQWAKLTEGDFFIHAKRYFRKSRNLKAELWPRSKYEIRDIQNEFDSWCLDNEQKIRNRIAKEMANSVQGKSASTPGQHRSKSGVTPE